MKFAREVIEYFEESRVGNISEEEIILKIQKIEPRVTERYRKSGNISVPPEDCKDYCQACQNIFATIPNMFLYYSKKGLETWPKSNREWLMRDTIKSFYDDKKEIEFEESKIH